MDLEYILWRLATNKPRELICYDEHFNYFGMGCLGYWLMYRKSRHRDGRRCFYLTDELAMCLGFEGLYEMRFRLSTLQYWRRFVSIERLRVALDRYHKKQDWFRQQEAELEL